MASLPSYVKVLREDFGEEPDPGVNRTDMDDGFSKQALKYSAATLNQIPMALHIESNANYQAFMSWYHDTIGRVGWFDWVNPITGATEQARLVGGKLKSRAMNGALTHWIIYTAFEFWRT